MGPQITGIRKGKKGLVDVFLDHDYAFSVTRTTAAALQIGEDLPAAAAEDILRRDQETRAYDQALKFLARRARSRVEVETHLRRKGHASGSVAAVVARLERLGYVDDAAFARGWVDLRLRVSPRSARALRHELWLKGVAQEAVEAALQEYDEPAAARAAAMAKCRLWERLDEKQARHKVMQLLARRGFDYETAQEAWNRVRRARAEENGPQIMQMRP